MTQLNIDGYHAGGWDNKRRAAIATHLLLDIPITSEGNPSVSEGKTQ